MSTRCYNKITYGLEGHFYFVRFNLNRTIKHTEEVSYTISLMTTWWQWVLLLDWITRTHTFIPSKLFNNLKRIHLLHHCLKVVHVLGKYFNEIQTNLNGLQFTQFHPLLNTGINVFLHSFTSLISLNIYIFIVTAQEL